MQMQTVDVLVVLERNKNHLHHPSLYHFVFPRLVVHESETWYILPFHHTRYRISPSWITHRIASKSIGNKSMTPFTASCTGTEKNCSSIHHTCIHHSRYMISPSWITIGLEVKVWTTFTASCTVTEKGYGYRQKSSTGKQLFLSIRKKNKEKRLTGCIDQDQV